MTIRQKSILLLLLVAITLAIAMVLTARHVILRGYKDLENDFAQRNLSRALNFLSHAVDKLSASAEDYASWDDSYEFVNNPDDSMFREDNFIASSFVNINVNAMLFFNLDNELVADAFTLSGEGTPGHCPPELVAVVKKVLETGSLKIDGSIEGIVTVDLQPVMLAAKPILQDGGSGSSRGTLVFCRFADSLQLSLIASILEQPVSLIPAELVAASDDSLQLREFIATGKEKQILVSSRGELHSFAWVKDVFGENRKLILLCHNSRDIYRYGLKTHWYSLVSLIIIVIIFSIVVTLFLEKSILMRFIRLRKAIETVKGKPEGQKRLPVSGNDEVTAITIDINSMLAAIDQEQERAEKSEQQYHLLFNQMLSGFVLCETILDNEGHFGGFSVLDVNPAFERSMGLKKESIVGCKLSTVLLDLGVIWEKSLSQVLCTGVPFFFECFSEFLAKHFEVMAFVADVNRCALTFTDITNRKKAEEEQEKAREELAQAQKMQAIGQLAGGVAHDFNNQLAGILGYADLLKHNLVHDQKLYKYTEKMMTGIRRAADLTSQLLAFAHKGKHIDRPVDMHTIVNEVIALLERTIDRKIVIQKKIGNLKPVILGDPTQLQNVILNLGLNARDAMPDGGVLTFATEAVILESPLVRQNATPLDPGHYLLVHVEDTGTGMSDEVQKHLFEPFFTTKPRGKGTGMGLAASFGTISQHGGAISVTTEPGKGTRFSIYLPLSEHLTVKTSEDVTGISIQGNPQILIIDDEPMVAEMAEETLVDMGCSVEVCLNGREATAFYRTAWKNVDVVLLDMIMPDMNGTETFNQLISINPGAKIIVSSGYSLNNEAQSLIDRGATGFLQKPYTYKALGEIISSALQ